MSDDLFTSSADENEEHLQAGKPQDIEIPYRRLQAVVKLVLKVRAVANHSSCHCCCREHCRSGSNPLKIALDKIKPSDLE